MAKNTTAPLDPLYEIEEACARLRCSPPTIYRLNDAGEVTVFKVRGKSLVAGVETLIKRQVEAAEQRRLTQEAGANAPHGIMEQSPPQGRRGRKRQAETPPDALPASLSGGAD